MAWVNGDTLFEGAQWHTTPCEPCLVRKNIFQGSVIDRKEGRKNNWLSSAADVVLLYK